MNEFEVIPRGEVDKITCAPGGQNNLRASGQNNLRPHRVSHLLGGQNNLRVSGQNNLRITRKRGVCSMFLWVMRKKITVPTQAEKARLQFLWVHIE